MSKKLDVIALDHNLPIKWKPNVHMPGFSSVDDLLTKPTAPVDIILSNTSLEEATDLIVVTGRFGGRPSKYVVATLDDEKATLDDELSPEYLSAIFEQFRDNWRHNLWVDCHPDNRDKGLHWNYSGTGMRLEAQDYMGSARKDAVILAQAYELIAQHCEEQVVGDPDMFRSISAAFRVVGKKRINTTKLTDDEKKRLKKLYGTYKEKSPNTPHSYIKHRFFTDTYEDRVAPKLVKVFFDELRKYEPFAQSGLLDMDPKMFYRSAELCK